MRFLKPLPPAVLLLAMSAPLAPVAVAHPGHSHQDIPALTRHPFAGLEHTATVALLLFAVATAGMLVWQLRRENVRHAAGSRTARQR